MTDREHLDELFTRLGLKHAAEVLSPLLKEAQSKARSFSWLLTQLLQHEDAGRQQRATQNREHRAAFPENWTLKTFPWERQPGVDQREILELAELEFLRLASNIVFIGDVGVGKTGLATGLGREAVQAGYSVQFFKVSELVDKLYASTLDRSTGRLIRRLARIDLIIIDEFSYVTLNEEQANLIFKLVDARYHKKSTIFTTNLGYNEWGKFLMSPALTRTLVDRVTDQCYVIRIEGPSLRPGPRPARSGRKPGPEDPGQDATGQGRKRGTEPVAIEAARSR